MFDLDNPDATAWMLNGLCAQIDSEPFFPDKGGSTSTAKKTCAACPVRTACLEYALAYENAGHYLHGIWGGVSQMDRRKLRGRKGRAA